MEDNKITESSFQNSNYVSLKHINKFYDKQVHAVKDFSLDISKHEFIVFVGPSGCGKSTTLRMIAGLEDISSGELYIDGVLSNELSPKDRNIAMVFQSYALYPNMTVFGNIAFGLKVRHTKKDEIKKRVLEAAKILEIEDLLNRKPKALSGGQRQRVALGRAIVRDARLFLMDEPLSNLDAKLRVQMRSEIIRLHRRMEATTIYVTHDQTEAMTMADRIVVMKDGVIQQIGTPLEIYKNPSNMFVASFIGSPAMNFIPAKYEKGTINFIDGKKLSLNKKTIDMHDKYYQGRYTSLKESMSACTTEEEKAKIAKEIAEIEEILNGKEHDIMFGVRPENIVEVDDKNKNAIKTVIKLSELLGDLYYVHFDFGGKDILSKVSTDKILKEGQNINLEIQTDKIHLFDPLTNLAIN